MIVPESLALLTTEAPPAGPAEADSIDLAGFLDYLRHERRMALNTQLAYRRDLDTFAAWARCGDMVNRLAPTAAELGRFLQHLGERGLSASSINRHLSAVKSLYRFLRLRDRIAGGTLTVVLQVKGPKGWRCLPSVLDAEEAERLMQEPSPADCYHLRDVALLETLYASGCRASEVCDLKLSDVKLPERRAEIKGKGGKQRIVLLNRSAVDAITAYLDQLRPHLARNRPESPWLFVSRSGRRLTREMLWVIVTRYALRAGLDAVVGPHTLRHTLATVLMTGGADLRVIQDLLGHSSLSTTSLYAHVDAQRMREIHRQFHSLGAAPATVDTTTPNAA